MWAQATKQRDRWETMKRKLYVKTAQAGGGNNVELAALRNAARALACCGGIDGNGGLCGGSRHRRDSKRWEKRNYEDVRSAASTEDAPIQLKKEDVQGGSTEMKIKKSKAMAVLNAIAAKAHLNVTQIVNNVKAMEGSKAKGGRTTERHRFIEIWSFDHLVKIANVTRWPAWVVRRCRKPTLRMAPFLRSASSSSSNATSNASRNSSRKNVAPLAGGPLFRMFCKWFRIHLLTYVIRE
jgi:hypothetical protein